MQRMSCKTWAIKAAYVAVLSIFLLFGLDTQRVQAGSLNENEAAVVKAAQGTFDWNGAKYKVDPVFIGQLAGYMNRDDVELTAEQRDEIISLMFSNVEQGIAQGYLIPAEAESGEQEEESKTGEQTGQENTREKDGDSSEISSSDAESSQTTEETKALNQKQAAIVKEIKKQPVTKVQAEADKITVKDENDSELVTVNTVIKNTGFNLDTTFAVGGGLVFLLAMSMSVTLACGFFRRER